MLSAACHCGAVRIEVPRRPRRLTECNCSICRRYGARWAYYQAAEVRVIAARGATTRYSWGDRMLAFVRCTHCGTVTHWQGVGRRASGRMGVNARNFDPGDIATVRVRRLDGAGSWKFLD